VKLDTTVTCETCSGSGDALIFETIDTPSTLSGGNKKIDRDVYSAQQILLRISTQWRKHQVQLIDRQLSALLSQSRRKNEQQEGDEAKQERKRKFDELVVGSDTKQDEISSKKFKLIQSNEESDNLPTSGGWNTWLSKKGYGGIQNFMNWLNEKRPLPFLADVLYPTEFADGYPFLTDAWRTLASVISSHTLMLNNELFAADQVRRGELQQFIEKHPTLPRASVYSCKTTVTIALCEIEFSRPIIRYTSSYCNLADKFLFRWHHEVAAMEATNIVAAHTVIAIATLFWSVEI
jgi:hypothetical protein